MRVNPIFDRWWISEPRAARQIFAGEEYNVMFSRGLHPTQEEAEQYVWRDDTESYWEHNLEVYADHCPSCGRFAQRLAGCSEGLGWSWEVTDCKQCGIIDSRNESK